MPDESMTWEHGPEGDASFRLPFIAGPPVATAALLLAASLILMLFARGGLPGFSGEAARGAWIASHTAAWRSAWVVVGLAMVGLALLFVWWAAQLNWREGTMPALLLVGVALAIDLTGISVLTLSAPHDAAAFSSVGNILAGGVATLLYGICFLWFLGLTFEGTRLLIVLAAVYCGAALAGVGALAFGSELGFCISLGLVFSITPILCLLLGFRFRDRPVSRRSQEYRLMSTWSVAATPAELAAILHDPESLQVWWKQVFLGSSWDETAGVVRLHTRGWLPYTLRLNAWIVDLDDQQGFIVDTEGDLRGRCICRVDNRGDHTMVHFDWIVRANKPIVRSLSWLLKPLFVSNHRWVMLQGQRGIELEVSRRREVARGNGLPSHDSGVVSGPA